MPTAGSYTISRAGQKAWRPGQSLVIVIVLGIFEVRAVLPSGGYTIYLRRMPRTTVLLSLCEVNVRRIDSHRMEDPFK